MTSTPPQYAQLFKTSNTGKVMEWQLVVEPNQAKPPTAYDIVTIYGETDGKAITKRATISEGKAGRTVLQQAIQEATRRYKNKKEKENYTETITNTNEIQMRPMLAQTFNPDLYTKRTSAFKLSFPLLVQPKLDGIRCITHISAITEDNTATYMMSRKGLKFTNFPHIVEELKVRAVDFTEEIYIDGELYTPELTFEKISGIVKAKTLTTEHIEHIHHIKYHIYDIYVPSKPEMGYRERHELLKGLFSTVPRRSYCELVLTETANKLVDIGELHNNYVEQGYEGIMLRDPMGPYEIDKRSKYLQKYKLFMEEEFVITGTAEEDGMILFECQTHELGNKFTVRPRGTFDARRDMFTRRNTYLGKQLTVIFQEYTELGTPRFPIGKSVRDYE
jgi:DNA ligase-1